MRRPGGGALHINRRKSRDCLDTRSMIRRLCYRHLGGVPISPECPARSSSNLRLAVLCAAGCLFLGAAGASGRGQAGTATGVNSLRNPSADGRIDVIRTAPTSGSLDLSFNAVPRQGGCGPLVAARNWSTLTQSDQEFGPDRPGAGEPRSRADCRSQHGAQRIGRYRCGDHRRPGVPATA